MAAVRVACALACRLTSKSSDVDCPAALPPDLLVPPPPRQNRLESPRLEASLPPASAHPIFYPPFHVVLQGTIGVASEPRPRGCCRPRARANSTKIILESSLDLLGRHLEHARDDVSLEASGPGTFACRTGVREDPVRSQCKEV